MHIGFTGTRKGMTKEQKATLRLVLDKSANAGKPGDRRFFHHGDCTGADEQAHRIADLIGYSIMIHPPEDDRFRAFCETEPGWRFVARDYLTRNDQIVANTERLIACPMQSEEQKKGGTWYTIRQARRMKRPIKIILPSGKVRNEGW